MNDDRTPDSIDDPPVVGAAFTRLRSDVQAVSTDAARHRLDAAAGRRAPWGPMLAGAAALVLVALGVFALRGDDKPELATDAAEDDAVPETDAATDPVSAEVLDGTAWVLADGTSRGLPIPLVDSNPVTVSFDLGPAGVATISGRAACNGYGASFTLDAGTGAFAISELGQELAGCDAQVEASETAYLLALDAVDRVELRGERLTFFGPDGVELLFIPRLLVPIDDIVGRTWQLESLVDGETVTPAGGEDAILELGATGTVVGGTGCRSLVGEWAVLGGEIRFPSFGAEGECTPSLVDQDGLVVTVLGDGFTAVIEGDTLRLSSVGELGLIYRLVDAGFSPSTSVPGADDEAADGPTDDSVSVDELVDARLDTWVDVVGYLDDRGGGAYLCAQPVVDFCGARWVVVVGEITAEPSAEPVVLRGALDEWGRLVVDPNAVVGDPAPDAFEGFIGLPVDGAVSSALLSGDLGDPALRWHPDGVALTLGGTAATVVRTPDEILDPANWTIEADGFRAYTGPFSALEALTGADQVLVNNGTHAHCAAPPMPLPDVAFDRQIVIQADGIDSCLQWFVVDVLLDAADRIVAVNLDLWEP